MQAIWKSIEQWLAEHAPAMHRSLRPPASQEELGSAEHALGIDLPEDIRASYLLHDGQQLESDSGRPPGLIAGWTLLPLKHVVAEWRRYRDLLDEGTFRRDGESVEGISAELWHPRWIPLTSIGSRDNHCVDLAPGTGGVSGQIIMWHGDGSRRVVAPSFRAWMRQFADELHKGWYVVGHHGDLTHIE